MNPHGLAGSRRLRPLVLGTAAAAVLLASGCGEKSEPAIHAPTTAPLTTTAPAPTTTATEPTATKPVQTPTAPVPKTTP